MSATRNPSLGPSPMRARKRRLFLIRFLIILFFILVVTFALAIFSDHEKVKIQTINISGNAAVQNDTILAIVNKDLAGRYWYLFSRSNFLIFPRFQIRNDILRELKTVKEVDISWTAWQTISITITERKPHSVWCGLIPAEGRVSGSSEAIGAECFFVDKTGYIYSEAPTFSGSMFVKDYGLFELIDNVSTSTDPTGQYFLPPSLYVKIFNLIDSLDQNNLKVVSVSFDGFDFKFTLEEGFTIIFNNKNDFDSSFANLFTALETKSLDLTKEVRAISYIDLRFDNKIVVGKNPIK